MRAETLLAAVQQTEREQPLIERDFAILEYRADCDRKGLHALFALVKAGARGLACHLVNA